MIECGHDYQSQASECSTGYGESTFPWVGTVRQCFACIAAQEPASMAYALPKARWQGYLSSDGRSIQGWPGHHLARVTYERESLHSGFGGLHPRTHVRATDTRGREWYGSGPGRGMYVRLRRCVS